MGLAIALTFLGYVVQQERERIEFLNWVRAVKVSPPETPPAASQESIEIALVLYGIEVPSSATHPIYDSTLRDRGLTLRGTWSEKSVVLIGPAAFDSWALLGSTLAHELLVHTQQNFFLISIMDILHLDGTGAAERQAYEYELSHADQFGLSREDRELVAATVAYYYPTSSPQAGESAPGSLAAMRIQRWLASRILPTE